SHTLPLRRIKGSTCGFRTHEGVKPRRIPGVARERDLMNRGWPSQDEGLSALLDRQSDGIVPSAAERQVSPGETARFPFAVTSGGAAPSLHDLDVVSEDPNFDRRWAHIVAVAGGAAISPQYVPQGRPCDGHRHP